MASSVVRRVWTWGLPLLAAVTCLSMLIAVLGAGKAKAAPSVPSFLGEITESEVPGGIYPQGLAVDPKSGDLYQSQGSRVVKLSPYGQFILAFGSEVDLTKVGRRKEEEVNKEPVNVTLEEEDICTAASGDDCSNNRSQGSAAGQFRGTKGVAVEPATGDVYVQDSSNDRIQKFAPSGRFLLMFGWQVNKGKVEQREAQEAKSEPVTVTAQEENLCAASEKCQAGKEGSGPGQIGYSANEKVIAVGGSSGKERIYVGGRARIEVFNGGGEYQEQLSLSSLSTSDSVSQLAANASGDVFFVDGGVSGVHMAETNGSGALELTSTVFDATSSNVDALAAEGGSLYVADGNPSFRVLIYEVSNPSGSPVQFGSSEPGELYGTEGLAVDGAGAVYVTNVNATRSVQKIDIYGSLAAIESAYGPPPSTAPTINSEIVHATVEEGTVELEAQVDPEWRETTYQFEYGSAPCSSGGCTKVPASPASLGTLTKTEHQALVGVPGLQTGVTYYYRVTAVNGAGSVQGPDRAFTVGAQTVAGPTGLPDGRVYEQVSPADKFGNEVLWNHPAFVAPDGNAAMFTTDGAVAENATSNIINPLSVSERTSHGWVTRSATPLPVPGKETAEEYTETTDFVTTTVPSSDLSHLLFATWKGAPFVGPPDENLLVNNIYLEGPDASAEPQWVGRSQIEGSPGGLPEALARTLLVAGTSPDLKTTYFSYGEGSEQISLFPGASGLYEYREGVLSDAGALPNGEASASMAMPAAQDRAIAGHGNAPGLPAPAGYDNQVSTDGSRIFFVQKDGAGQLELYVHTTATDGSQSTALISQSQLSGQAGQPAPDGPLAMASTERQENGAGGSGFQVDPLGEESWPSFVFASPDGSHAFFESADRLTEDAPANAAAKTYVFDLETGRLEYLPAVSGPIVTVGGGGSWLFFENTTHSPYQLERWVANSSGGVATPIAELPSPSQNACGTVACVGSAFASSDGKVVVFETESAIPGFNDGGSHDLTEILNGREFVNSVYGLIPNQEIFRWEAEGNRLSCVSCPGKGTIPKGDAVLSTLDFYGNAIGVSGDPEVITPGRSVSADGSRVFFETTEALVPQDVNGTGDVYEWENGKVFLISSGHSPERSVLAGVSESGGDVFFITAEGIAPGDVDGSYDLYDARVPRPGDNPPPEAIPCEGAVCQGPPSVPNLLGQPASEAFNGAGNLAPPIQVSHASAKSLTQAEKLARALAACEHRKSARKRRQCETQARKKHGAKSAKAGRAGQRAGRHNGRGK